MRRLQMLKSTAISQRREHDDIDLQAVFLHLTLTSFSNILALLDWTGVE
jgi:hypothetical protein